MPEYYGTNNVKQILPFLPRRPKWLIVGGPADSNEAQYLKGKWPDIKIIGIEPNPEAVEWQKTVGEWPPDAYLIPSALGDEPGKVMEMIMEPGRLHNASLEPKQVEDNRSNANAKFLQVTTVTLDGLDSIYGPFEDAVVWMDIEGSEYRALQGATNLIKSGRVLLWNIEMLNRVPGLMEGVPRLLAEGGYKAVYDWNDSDWCRDRIFIREGPRFDG